MGKYGIFVIRVGLSTLFAFLATRIFFGKVVYVKVLGLAAIMLGLAYLFEFLRKRGKGEDHGT